MKFSSCFFVYIVFFIPQNYGMLRIYQSTLTRRTTNLSRFMRGFGSDPSLEQLEAQLTRPLGGSCVTEILGSDIVRVNSMQGISVGTEVSVGLSGRGVVLQFDSNSAMVALRGSNNAIFRGSEVSLIPPESPTFKFRVKSRNRFSSPHVKQKKGSLVKSSVPVVDMLLSPHLTAGKTVGIYSPWFKAPNSLDFPRVSDGMNAFDLYKDLFDVANKAVTESEKGLQCVHLVADFRNFHHSMEFLQYQVGNALPVPPHALIASVLQLAQDNLSVTAIFNSEADFKGEAIQNVDVPIQLGESGEVKNLFALLQRFAGPHVLNSSADDAQSSLVEHLLNGFRFKADLSARKEAGIFIDFWDQDSEDSFNTLVSLLGPVAEKYASCSSSETQRTILLRALTVLHFNKSSKKSSALTRFPLEVLDTLEKSQRHLGSIEEIDYALREHRFDWELTNELF